MRSTLLVLVVATAATGVRADEPPQFDRTLEERR
jgi:hypothetical protein